MRRHINPRSPSRPINIARGQLSRIIDANMAPEDKVHGEPDVKRDNGLQMADLLGCQPDAQGCEVGQQMLGFALGDEGGCIGGFVEDVGEALFQSVYGVRKGRARLGGLGHIPTHETAPSSPQPSPPAPPTTSHHSPTTAPSSHHPLP